MTGGQWPALEQTLLWLRYQDSNGCGLLEVHEAADWADLLANRFNVLYDNVLWYAALGAMAEMAQALEGDNSRYAEIAGTCATRSASSSGWAPRPRTSGAQLSRSQRVAAHP